MQTVTIAAMLTWSGPGDLDLRWEAPPNCPDGQQMAARLGVLPSGGDRDPVKISATVEERDAGHWVLELELTTHSGSSRRRVDASDCRTLAETTALVTAVYLGGRGAVAAALAAPAAPAAPRLQRPRATSSVVASRPAPATLEESATPVSSPSSVVREKPGLVAHRAPTPSVAREGSPARGPTLPLHAALYLAGGAGAGALPQVDLTASLGVGLIGRRWRIEMVGSRWFPREAAASGGVGVNVDMWSGSLAAGPRFERRKLSFPILANVELGAMHGRGSGSSVVARRDAWSPWVAAGLTAGLAWGVHRNVALWARASGFVTVYRPRFLVEGAGTAYTAGAGGGRLTAGVELRFPGIDAGT